MKTYPPNFGGWLASTEKEPHKLLHTIWERARKSYAGLIGISGLKENILVFTGIQIQVEDKDPMSDDLGYPLTLKITDGKRIQPEFFDLWEHLKANHYVHDGPDEEDKAFFCSWKYARLLELDDWVNIYYSYPITRGRNGQDAYPRYAKMCADYSMALPNWLFEKKIQDRAREREQRYGEKFTYKITRKKNKNRFDG